jgi:hypothetical protein
MFFLSRRNNYGKEADTTSDLSQAFYRSFADSARGISGRMCERSTRCKEKRATQHKLSGWLQDIEKVKAGILTQDEYDVGKRQQFALEKHLSFFQEHLKAKGATDRYIRETQSRILHVCTECKFHRLADMNAAVLMRWLTNKVLPVWEREPETVIVK